MAAYEYAPLPPPANGEQDIHIRLMKLSPGEKTGEISCSITSCLLSQPPEYEAVSYCWGDANDKAQIKCEGQLITIPSNLHAFLLRTRAKGTERTLWIDSICINQTDQAEKTSQVAAMRHIYRMAKRTLIWLGKEAEQSSLGLEFAQKLYTTFMDSANQEKEKKKAVWYRPQLYDDFSSVFGPEWGAFFRLFNREWFTRAWVVQEIAVSSDPWVITGDNAIRWSVLVTAIFYVLTAQTWIFEFYGSHNVNILSVMQISQNEVTQGLKTMHYEILIRHRQSLSSDPRDHIFAFYGISSHDSFKEYKIEPDYKLSASRLYTDIAVSTLRKTSNLDFLDIPRLSLKPNILNLPSWVPDWSASESICFSFMHLEFKSTVTANQAAKYAATGDSAFTPIIDESLSRLELSGYTIDRIASVSHEWVVQDTSGYQSIRKQAQVLKQNQIFIHDWETVIGVFSRAPYPTGESRQDVLWQVCVAGFFLNGKEQTKHIFDRFEKRQSYLRILRRLYLHNFMWVWMLVVTLGHILRLCGIPNPEIMYRTLVSCMVNRRAMMTANGYVGMVPKIAEVGDYIVLCKGGKLPLVLRPHGKDWEFIGDCYVHGMMNGEVWEERKCEKVVLV